MPGYETSNDDLVLANLVVMFNLGTRVDLKHIARSARNVEYRPKRFSAAIMRIRDPKTTSLIFWSGKVVVTGAKDIDSARIAARKHARILQKIGYENAVFRNFSIVNMVARFRLPYKVNLEKFRVFLSHLSSRSHYEPEIFPAATFYVDEAKVTAMIFGTGCIILSGAKNQESMDAAYAIVKQMFTNYESVVRHNY
jgi:transcription initiation factor TFIID TATA-box-binding protein